MCYQVCSNYDCCNGECPWKKCHNRFGNGRYRHTIQLQDKILTLHLCWHRVCNLPPVSFDEHPERILPDGASVLESELMKDIYKFLWINKDTSSPYHYQSHSQVERMNGILREIISLFVNAEQVSDISTHHDNTTTNLSDNEDLSDNEILSNNHFWLTMTFQPTTPTKIYKWRSQMIAIHRGWNSHESDFWLMAQHM